MVREGKRARVLGGTSLWLAVTLLMLVAWPMSASDSTALPSLEELHARASDRLGSLSDISGTLVLRQYDSATSAVSFELVVDLQLVKPSVARLAIKKPDLYAGDVYAFDYQADRAYIYSFIFDAVSCSTIDGFLQQSPVGNIEQLMTTVESLVKDGSEAAPGEGLFTIPAGDEWGRIDVVDVETLNGRQYAVIRVLASDEVLEEGLDVIEDTLEGTALGSAVDVGADDTLYVWVDLEHGMVRQMKVVDGEGKPMYVLELQNLKMDSGLNAAALLRFPGAENRCRLPR